MKRDEVGDNRIESDALDLPADVLASYLEGEPMPISDAMAQIGRLNAAEARQLLSDALLLPVSDPKR